MDAHLTRRAAIGSAAALFAAPVFAACAPRVLFVCRYGSVKSPFARELLRRRAAERGLPIDAVSRGLTPDDHADAAFLKRVADEGLDLNRQPLTRLDASALKSADIVISFEPLAGAGLQGARDWSDTPSMLGDYPAARAAIAARIEGLLDELAGRRC